MAYKAFVSSTFKDLKQHRMYVIGALRKAGISVDPMEDWTAASDEPKRFSQDRIKDCDLCVLLVAFRRGYIPEGETSSITQMEYQAAVNLGIDVLVFMLDEHSPWPRKFDELDKDPEVREWRADLKKKRGVGFFGLEPHSIEIAPALTRWITHKQQPELTNVRGLSSNISQPRPGQAIFHYFSSRRIGSLYDQLPDEAFQDDVQQPNVWIIRGRIDTMGDQGIIEERLRTYQRQLAVILNYWQKTICMQELVDVLLSDDEPDRGSFYRCFAEFSVEHWDPFNRTLTLRTEIAGFSLKIVGSKENFPGLSKSGPDHRYEPNSLMPNFFLGQSSMRLLGYIQCEYIDRQAKEFFGGALCLVSNPPESEIKDKL